MESADGFFAAYLVGQLFVVAGFRGGLGKEELLTTEARRRSDLKIKGPSLRLAGFVEQYVSAH